MEVVDGRSSSYDLSSAPNSDVEGSRLTHPNSHPLSNTITASHNNTHGSSITLGNQSKSASTQNNRLDAVQPKTRRPRKKKDSDAASTTEKKEKQPRKPRSSTGVTASRKKIKAENTSTASTAQTVPLVSTSEPVAPHGHYSTTPLPVQPSAVSGSEAAKYSQKGPINHNSAMQSQPATPIQYHTVPAPAPVVRSTAVYDPVRSVAIERKVESAAAFKLQSTLSTPPRITHNPSMSPSISSIINLPDHVTNNSKPPTPLRTETEPPRPSASAPPPSEVYSNAMEIDPPTAVQEPAKKTLETTKPASKPRAKEQPPPLPTGSGLLSSSLFGGDSGAELKSSTEKGTSIVLHVDLKNPDNKVVNFARMAEDKYGFAAMYPRQAAQKERLARVAAAGAALERSASGNKLGGTSAGDSGDEDLSFDLDRESDNDGDVAMSGFNGTNEAANSGTDGPAPKRRKRKDEYDADDPFVDDSELLWEAQAAASKDGFFVYCGPLVPEGEKPTVERADGTVKRGRGRGRGGGPGSRGGRGGASSVANSEGGTGSGRGGGPGSRGGGITRKPRITKAERAQRELEKKQREQVAVLASKPPAYPS